MAITEIQNVKPVETNVMPTITSIPISESFNQKNIENGITDSEIKSKRSDEVKNATEEKIQRVSELMNNYIQSMQRDIKIQVHGDTGDIVVKVISEESGKIIRQIPSEELLDLAARMEEISGTLFDQNV
ncbi:MAG: flagellar protein FlaG [Desulfobacteraceae bacterium]|jgi:flagellar protein FlaG